MCPGLSTLKSKEIKSLEGTGTPVSPLLGQPEVEPTIPKPYLEENTEPFPLLCGRRQSPAYRTHLISYHSPRLPGLTLLWCQRTASLSHIQFCICASTRCLSSLGI